MLITDPEISLSQFERTVPSWISSDVRRKVSDIQATKMSDSGIEDLPGHPLISKYSEYLRELLTEKHTLDKMGSFSNAQRLLSQEIERIHNGGKPISKEDRKFVDVTKDKPIKVSARVVVPIKDHPKFNFVGKLLGPKGNSLKRLQEETMTKMAILGRGSMRDKQKEEDLRGTCDPRYCHLHEDLHVEVNAFAPPAEAHARLAYALAEVRRFLVPDYNDEIRLEQIREMQLLNGVSMSNNNEEVSNSTSGSSCMTSPSSLISSPNPILSPNSLKGTDLMFNSQSSSSVSSPTIAGESNKTTFSPTRGGCILNRLYPSLSSRNNNQLSKKNVLTLLNKARVSMAKETMNFGIGTNLPDFYNSFDMNGKYIQ